MTKSAWVYRKLRNFRAGIEAGISCFKRAYGADGAPGRPRPFKAYVWSAVVAHNWCCSPASNRHRACRRQPHRNGDPLNPARLPLHARRVP